MRLLADLVLTEAGWKQDRAVAIAAGRIAAVENAGVAQPGDVLLAGKALMPGTINAHCHTFQALLRGLGDDLDFMGWRDRVLYPFSERLDRRAIALGAQLAFVEQLLHGVTTCVDFFYLQDDGNENAEAVIEAARTIGMRLVLARTMYDPPIDLRKNVVYAMSAQAVTDVWVHGRRVVENGRLVTIDVAELLARVRELTKGWRAWTRR